MLNYDKDILPKMNQWRALDGAIPIPESYLIYHHNLALAELEILKQKGYSVSNVKFEDDGWLDGMKVIYATITKDSVSKRIKWHDSHRTGNFFEYAGGGWAIFRY